MTAKKEPIYINPLTDFGFKRLFGDKVLMMNFLNSLLNIEGGITDLTYQNTVRTGESKTDRTAIYDLHCQTAKGEHIIVEMQMITHENFQERTVYYASRLIQEQGRKGKDWQYDLKAVYSVNIVNFLIDPKRTDKKYLSFIQLKDETNDVFYDKLTFVYIELPRFTINRRNLKTDNERWVFALKYLPRLFRLPKALHQEIFKKLFEQAKIAKMTKREREQYLKSITDMNIVKNEFTRMSNQITTLTNQNTTLSNQNTTLTNQITAQANKIAELEKMLQQSEKIAPV
jgi:predicted transposase/invertase (TIGR01784 family)